jgi:hypothetical protein
MIRIIFGGMIDLVLTILGIKKSVVSCSVDLVIILGIMKCVVSSSEFQFLIKLSRHSSFRSSSVFINIIYTMCVWCGV